MLYPDFSEKILGLQEVICFSIKNWNADKLPLVGGRLSALFISSGLPQLLTKSQIKKPEQSPLCSGMERMTGIEPATPAWEAEVLPLNYIRTVVILYYSSAKLSTGKCVFPVDKIFFFIRCTIQSC